MENCQPQNYIKVFHIEDILDMLPHRYPFLLVDKVYVKEMGKSGWGQKNVTINEPFFRGHFMNHPIVPGVLIVESVAQTIAIIYNSTNYKESNNATDIIDETLQDHVGYLGAVNMKFLRTIMPGEVMYMYVELTNKVQNISSYDVKVFVNNNVAAKGSITVTEK